MLKKDNLKLLIDKKRIKKRLKSLGDRITKDYKGKHPIFIGVLNGSFMFLADLIRNIKLDAEIDFLQISSYDDRKISSGNIKMLLDLNTDITERDVIVIEDVIDSGTSVKYIRDLISSHKPASLEFASLLYKKGLSKLNFKIKYIGFRFLTSL